MSLLLPHRQLLLPKRPYLLGVSTQTSTSTPITLNLSRWEAGVLNIAFIYRHAGGTAAPGLPTGWTSLTSSTTDPDFRLAYLFSDGSIASTATSAATSGTSFSAIVMSFGGVHSSRIPVAGGVATATSTTPNPGVLSPSHTASGDWVCGIAYCAWNGNGTMTEIPGGTSGTLTTRGWQVNEGTNGGCAVAITPSVPWFSWDQSSFTLSASLVNRAGTVVVRSF